jgi:hypothetical protein
MISRAKLGVVLVVAGCLTLRAQTLQPVAASQTPIVLTVHGVEKPKLIRSAAPSVIPEPHGLFWKTTTTVVVGYTVGTDGHTHDIHIVKSKGPKYDPLAMAAIARYVYQPATKNGVPVAVTMKHGVGFTHANNWNPGPMPPLRGMN